MDNKARSDLEIIDFEFVENFRCFLHEKYYVYGAGHHGKEVVKLLALLKAEFVTFIETTTNHESCNNCISLSDFNDDSAIVIIASNQYCEEMILNLKTVLKVGIKAVTFYAFMMAIYLNRKSEFMDYSIATYLSTNYELYRMGLPIEYASIFLDAYKNAITCDLPLILTPGKVGSRTIYNSLNGNAIHLHSVVVPYAFETTDKEKFLEMRKKVLRKGVRIITAVRNPFSRDVSAFLQNTEKDRWPWYRENANAFLWYSDFLHNNRNYSDIFSERFLEWNNTLTESCSNYLNSIVNYKCDEFSWFDYEIKAYFGIDVYEKPFNFEKGYEIYRDGCVEILLIKLECIKKLSNIIESFVGQEGFKLYNSNEGFSKNYSYIYDGLKKNVEFSEEYVQYYLSNSKCLHFYSIEELKSVAEQFLVKKKN